MTVVKSKFVHRIWKPVPFLKSLMRLNFWTRQAILFTSRKYRIKRCCPIQHISFSLFLYKASASRFKECKYTVYMIQVFAWKVHFHCPKIRSTKSPCSLLFLSLQSKTISRWSNPVWAWMLLKLYLSDQITISSDWPNSFPPAYYRPLVSSKSASFTCKTFCETDNQNYHPYSVFYQT